MLSAKAVRESREVRTVTLALLGVSERLLAVTQRANERAMTRLRLRVKAWQFVLDPETRTWVGETKEALVAGALEQDAVDSEEAVRRVEQARRDLSA